MGALGGGDGDEGSIVAVRILFALVPSFLVFSSVIDGSGK